MSVNGLEAIWLVTCLVGIFLTAALLIDAIAERRAYIRGGGNGRYRARKLVLDGTVRRDSHRLLAQALLLTAIGPSLLRAGEVALTLDTPVQVFVTVAIVSLILVPVVLLVSSLLDARDRQRLRTVSEQIVLSERELTDANIIAAIEKVGADLLPAVKDVGKKAEAAYHEANTINLKLADLNTQLVAQGDRAEAEIARTDDHQGVQDGRIEAVEDKS